MAVDFIQGRKADNCVYTPNVRRGSLPDSPGHSGDLESQEIQSLPDSPSDQARKDGKECPSTTIGISEVAGQKQ